MFMYLMYLLRNKTLELELGRSPLVGVPAPDVGKCRDVAKAEPYAGIK